MHYPFAVLIAIAGILAACATINRPLHDLCAKQMVAHGFTEAQAFKGCRNALK